MPDHRTDSAPGPDELPDDELVAALLRRSWKNPVPPSVSEEFDARLARRLTPRRLSPGRRRFLIAYALLGVAVSLGLMRESGMAWTPSLAAIAAPPLLIVAFLRRQICGRR